MSFTFGGSSTPSFGSTPTKPTGFGAPLAFGTPASTTTTTSTGFGGFGTSTFGATATQPSFGATATQPSFGATATQPTFGATATQPTFGATATQPTFGSTFGQPAASAPAPGFGTSTFGQPTAAVAPTFGSSFGAPTATSAPAFGSTTFGATTTSAAPAFGCTFGAPTPSGIFGPTTTKPNLFGGTSAPSLFSTPTATTTSLFGTGTQTTSLFGAPTSTPSLFGTATTTSAPLFGSTFGTTTTSAPNLFGSTTPSLGLGTGLFGSTPATTQSLFSGFGTTTTSAGGFGGFGGFGTTATPSLFGSTGFGAKPGATAAPAQAVPPLQSLAQQVVSSCYSINIFGDERDEVLKKWNILQACWGTGKGYHSAGQPAIEYNHKNPFYRFKTVSYTVIPNRDNSEGMVQLFFNKKSSEMANQKEILVNGINGIMGNKPNLIVTIENLKTLTDNTCEVTISVAEKGVTGTTHKVPATELAAFLNQPMQKQQLATAGVYLISPFAKLTQEQIRDYLNNPPSDVDLQLWKAAIEDNPDPTKFVPAQVNGFTDLKKRMVCQEAQTGLQRGFIHQTMDQIQELKKQHSASIAQISELKQKFMQLQHRLLRILVKQESTRKIGMTLQPDEERLRERLEAMRNIVESPNQFRGQIRDLLSSVRYIHCASRAPQETYQMDPKAQDDIKQFLQMQQQGIAELVKIVNDDLGDLKTIHDGLNEVFQMKR